MANPLSSEPLPIPPSTGRTLGTSAVAVARWPRRRVEVLSYLLVAPTAVIILGVIVFPMLDSLLLSLEKYNLPDPDNDLVVGHGD